jgi:outer membrane protein assembly factor BamB
LGLLLCLFGAGKGLYGQEGEPGSLVKKIGGRDLSSYLAVGRIRDQQKPSATDGVYRHETRGLKQNGAQFQGIRKVTIESGTIIWEKDLNSTYAQPIISNLDTVIYASGATIYALNVSTGDQVWVNSEMGSDGVFSNMAHGGKYLYVSDREGGLFAIDPLTGKTVWSFPSGDWESPDYIDYGKIVSPVVVGNGETIYGASFRYIYSLDGLTGNVNWKIKTDAIANNRKWKEFGSQHYSSPLLTDSGVVYFSFAVFDDYGESDWERWYHFGSIDFLQTE